ncbi:MAG: imidazole glycerol phosphate synthase subunit HisH [Kineosporiaceae bacterium]
MTGPVVAVMDHGFGNVRSAAAALARVGADVTVTADARAAEEGDGLYVPGVGAFAAVVEGIRALGGDRVIERRLAGGRPVLAVCVGLQALFEASDEEGAGDPTGLAQWPGTVSRLPGTAGARVPHMGWNTVAPADGSRLFAGVETERFYFVHSYAVRCLDWDQGGSVLPAPRVTWAEHGVPFVAAAEHGALAGTQFHPEKSGDAGLHLLDTWVRSLR